MVAILFHHVVGVPFSFHKIKGGFDVEWVGYAMDYKNFAAGIFESRSLWLQEAIKTMLDVRRVNVGDFESFLGRLGFAAGPLEMIRPFLAFGYAWVHMIPGHACAEIPLAVIIVLKWFLNKLTHGGRMRLYRTPERSVGEWFRSDAHASAEGIGIGGWGCLANCPVGEARWFSVTLGPQNADWLFMSTKPSSLIASLGLLATLVSIVAFVPMAGRHRVGP